MCHVPWNRSYYCNNDATCVWGRDAFLVLAPNFQLQLLPTKLTSDSGKCTQRSECSAVSISTSTTSLCLLLPCCCRRNGNGDADRNDADGDWFGGVSAGTARRLFWCVISATVAMYPLPKSEGASSICLVNGFTFASYAAHNIGAKMRTTQMLVLLDNEASENSVRRLTTSAGRMLLFCILHR